MNKLGGPEVTIALLPFVSAVLARRLPEMLNKLGIQ